MDMDQEVPVSSRGMVFMYFSRGNVEDTNLTHSTIILASKVE
jgi:hypothetical protein